MFISSAFAQTVPAATNAGAGAAAASPFSGLLLPVVMLVVRYFTMIRPQMKKQKEVRAMLEALAKGDEVATAGGLLGRIAQLGDNHLTLEVADGVQVRVQRHAIVQVLPKGSLK